MKDNLGIDVFTLYQNIAGNKKSSRYRIFLRKVSPGRQFTGKNPSRPSGRRVGRILPINCRPGRFWWERSYNGAPAITPTAPFSEYQMLLPRDALVHDQIERAILW